MKKMITLTLIVLSLSTFSALASDVGRKPDKIEVVLNEQVSAPIINEIVFTIEAPLLYEANFSVVEIVADANFQITSPALAKGSIEFLLFNNNVLTIVDYPDLKRMRTKEKSSNIDNFPKADNPNSINYYRSFLRII